jgi:hypothetical protein
MGDPSCCKTSGLVRDGLQNEFAPTGATKNVAHILAVVLLELGR